MVYVDDPKVFQVLAHVFPSVQLVQDAFHLLDRCGRPIAKNNTFKGKCPASFLLY